MFRGQTLLLITCALALYGVGNVWLVQLSSYPLWRYVPAASFEAYHIAWWHSIWGAILAPAVLLFVLAVLMPGWRPAGVPAGAAWVGVALQVALVVGTATWWGPLMARLGDASGGLAPDRYRLLMTTHWLRVALVTAYGLLTLWMVAQSGRSSLAGG